MSLLSGEPSEMAFNRLGPDLFIKKVNIRQMCQIPSWLGGAYKDGQLDFKPTPVQQTGQIWIIQELDVNRSPFTVLMLKDSRDLIFDLLWWMAWSTLNMGGTSKKMRETSRIHTWPAAMWKGWSSVCLLLSVKGFLNCIVPLPPPEHKTIVQWWNDGTIEFTNLSGWCFGTCFILPYTGNNNPNSLIFFPGLETTNQLQ